jgi:hypothetical protein
MIAAATAKSEWSDWKILHVEKGPFGNEMVIDYYRWKRDKILSVLVQAAPKTPHQATPLSILDFTLEQ